MGNDSHLNQSDHSDLLLFIPDLSCSKTLTKTKLLVPSAVLILYMHKQVQRSLSSV